MAGDYLLRLYNASGVHLADIDDFSDLDYTLLVNDASPLTVTVPSIYDGLLFAGGQVVVDTRIEIWRRAGGAGQPYLEGETQWLVLRGVQEESGERRSILHAQRAPHLLGRRIVDYAAGSSQASKSNDPADDMMKAIVRENLGTLATDPDRDISAWLAVQPDTGQGVSVTKAFSRRIVLNVLQELAQTSTQAGTYIAFDVVSATPALLEFRTYAGQRGTDRRWPGGTAPVLVGAQYGNLTGARLDDDRMAEANFITAGGQDEAAAREIANASDLVRIAQSPIYRRERFRDARFVDLGNAAALQREADAALREGRPRRVFSGNLTETPGSIYGLHYQWGDFLTVDFRGQSVDCRLDAVHVRMEQGRETLDIQLRGELGGVGA